MSDLKKTLKKLPVVADLARWYNDRSVQQLPAKIVKAIAASPYEQGRGIAQALWALDKPLSEEERSDIERIERIREHYLAVADPLVDGSLGEGGPYDVGVSVKEAFSVSKPPRSALFLYLLVRALRPRTVLELGTNTGMSSSFIASALRRNGSGTVLTLDGSAYRQKLARKVHEELELTNVSYGLGLFTESLDPALATMPLVDLVFIDGHHQYQPTLDYYDKIRKNANLATTFVFDDIRWSDGMKRAWSELQVHPTTGLAVDLNSVGITTLKNSAIPGVHVMDELFTLRPAKKP